jgi:Undecaprenyl-phosphate glucose phosphotransferase
MTVTAAVTPLREGVSQRGAGSAPVRPRRNAVSRRIATDIVGIADAASIIIGGLVAAALLPSNLDIATDWTRLAHLGLVSAVFVRLVLDRFGMYDQGRLHELPVRPKTLLAALAIALTAVLGLWLPVGTAGPADWMALMASWLTASFLIILASRLTARGLLSRLTASGTFDTRLAVYGSGSIARRVEKYLADPALGIRFAGLFDDRTDQNRRDPDGPTLRGSLGDLVATARGDEIDHIVIALPPAADRRLDSIVKGLEHLPVRISIVTHLASDLIEAGSRHRVASVGTVGLIDVKAKPLDGWGRAIKAVEDYVLGTLLLLIAAPILALIALAVKLDSPGPVLFRQRRHGRNQQVFDVLKFRTMHVMENGASVRQATRDDPRVTRVGRFLRRTSLDELPQLVNVLRGEMSLVGPRPHALAHDQHYGEILARYTNRQQVKPGITGLAQIKGLRGETETVEKMEARLREDLAYVNDWSIWLDLKILALTGVRVWGNRNAY